MSNTIFPALKGLGWPVNHRPYFSTINVKMASGQEVRIANYPYPLEEFDLPINHLHSAPWGSPANAMNAADYQTLRAFFEQRLGGWDSFLYLDPLDNYTITNATNEGLTPTYGQNIIGTGAGSQLSFQFYRNLGGSLTPIYDIAGVTAGTSVQTPAVKVYVAGSAVLSGWTMSTLGVLTFVSAPTGTVAVDCQYYKRVVFRDDSLDFVNFLSQISKTDKLGLRQVYA